MDYLCICNLGSDDISYIDREEVKRLENIDLRNDINRVGPHGICFCKNRLYTANSYSNDITELELNGEITRRCSLGVSCTDIVEFENKLYVLCGDSNTVAVIDCIDMRLLNIIPCGSLPHSMCLNKYRREIFVSNLMDDTINIFDIDDFDSTRTIKVGSYPMGIASTMDNEYILVCESNIGMDFNGSLCLISLHNGKVVNRVSLGRTPVDIYNDGIYCYVSNHADGSISVINAQNWSVVDKFTIGGMPKGIVCDERRIFVCDSYNNSLIAIDKFDKTKKIIPIGREPMRIIKT